MNQTKIWDHFQVAAVENFDDAIPRLDFLVRQLLKRRREAGLRVLNIGTGNGWLERKCVELGFDVHAIDPSAVTIARLAAEGIAATVGSIADLPYADGFFDAVFCSEVLEHLDDATLAAGLVEVGRVLKTGGHLIGTVPFREDLSASMVVCPDCGKVFHRWGHQRSFDKDDLRLALSRGGLRVAAITTYAFPDYSKKLPFNRLRQWLRWILGRMGSGHVYTNLYFIVAK